MHPRLDHLSRLLRRGHQGEGQPRVRRPTPGSSSSVLPSPALAFIELAASNPYGQYTPAMLVGVIFVCIVGDRRMQISGRHLRHRPHRADRLGRRAARYRVRRLRRSSTPRTIAVITLICARTVGSLTGSVNFQPGHRRAQRDVRRLRPRRVRLGPRHRSRRSSEGGLPLRPEHPARRAGGRVHPQRRARSLHPGRGLAAERTRTCSRPGQPPRS